MNSLKQKRILQEADSEPDHTSTMELLVKIVKYFSLNIFLNPLSKMCDGALNALLTSINGFIPTKELYHIYLENWLLIPSQHLLVVSQQQQKR